MTVLTPSARAVIESDHPAHLVTLNPDGSPHVTLAWVGLREYLVVYGIARIEEGGAAELPRRLARVYIGPDTTFPPDGDPPPGWITRITPHRLGGAGPLTRGE